MLKHKNNKSIMCCQTTHDGNGCCVDISLVSFSATSHHHRLHLHYQHILYLTNYVTCQQNYLLLQQCSHPLYLHYLCLLSSTLSLLPYQSVVTVHVLICYITSGVLCYMLMCLILVCCRTKDACRSCSQGR